MAGYCKYLLHDTCTYVADIQYGRLKYQLMTDSNLSLQLPPQNSKWPRRMKEQCGKYSLATQFETHTWQQQLQSLTRH